MSDIVYLTAEGAERLRNELEEKKGPMREQLAKRLRAAIEQGDLSENADYSAAKEEQSFLEGRIQYLEHVLKNFVLIEDQDKTGNLVVIGSTVTIQEEDSEPEVFQLVGPNEADPARGRISHESPIGKALLGCQKGDEVQVDTPGGSISLKILTIE